MSAERDLIKTVDYYNYSPRISARNGCRQNKDLFIGKGILETDWHNTNRPFLL